MVKGVDTYSTGERWIREDIDEVKTMIQSMNLSLEFRREVANAINETIGFIESTNSLKDEDGNESLKLLFQIKEKYNF